MTGGPESILWRAEVAPETLSGHENLLLSRALADFAKETDDPKIKDAAHKASLEFARESIVSIFRTVQQNPTLKKAVQERIDEHNTKFNEGLQEMAGILTLGEEGFTKTPLEQVQQIYDGENRFSPNQRRMVAIAWGRRVLREGFDSTEAVELIDFIVKHPREGVSAGSIDSEAALELGVAALEGSINPQKPRLFRDLGPRQAETKLP